MKVPTSGLSIQGVVKYVIDKRLRDVKRYFNDPAENMMVIPSNANELAWLMTEINSDPASEFTAKFVGVDLTITRKEMTRMELNTND